MHNALLPVRPIDVGRHRGSHVVRVLDTIHDAERRTRAVMLDHRRRVLRVGREPMAHGFGFIVGSPDQVAAAIWTGFAVGMKGIRHGLRQPAAITHSTRAHPADNLPVRDLDEDHDHRRAPDHFVQRVCLPHRSRISIQDESARHVRFLQPDSDEIGHQVVADERPLGQRVGDLPAEFAAGANRRSQNFCRSKCAGSRTVQPAARPEFPSRCRVGQSARRSPAASSCAALQRWSRQARDVGCPTTRADIVTWDVALGL